MKKLRICLDYGHGGKDPGAVYMGRKEADDNLVLGRLVARDLRKNGFFVVETRSSDYFVSLGDRVRYSNINSCDYFISFHRNAYIREKARGVEVYTYPGASPRARSLGRDILSRLGGLGFKNRGLKQGNFYVLKRTQAPALLLEIGFIDNTLDNDLFSRRLVEISRVISQEIIKRAGQ